MKKFKGWSDKHFLHEFALDNISEAVFWLSIDGSFLHVNAAASEILKYTSEELLSMCFYDLIEGGDSKTERSELQELTRKKTMLQTKILRAADGRVFPVEMKSRYFHREGAEYICCIVRDISERTNTEKEAHLFRVLIEQALDPFYAVSKTKGCKFVYVNDAACRHFGKTRKNLLSMRIYDLDPDYDENMAHQLYAELKKHKSARFETQHLTPRGPVPVEVTANYVKVADDELIAGYIQDISRRSETETELLRVQAELEKRVRDRTAELAEAVERLRFTQYAIDHAMDPAFWMTRDGSFFYVNNAACNALGYSREYLLNMSLSDIDSRLTSGRLASLWKDLQQNGSLTFESFHRSKEGHEYPVEIRGNYVVRDGKGCYCAFATDITQRRKAEEFLLLSRYCLDKAAIGIFDCDEVGTIHWANDYACRMLGYSTAEISALTVFDIDPAATKEKITALRKTLDETGSVTHETVHRRSDGTIFPVEINANRVDFGGRSYTFSFVKDVTDRKLMEEALRTSEAEKSLILNSITDSVCYHGKDMHIVWGNRIYREVFAKVSEEDLCGRFCWELLHRRSSPCGDCPVIAARDSNEIRELERRTPDGAILRMRAFPVIDNGSMRGVVEIVSDITEQKQAEEAMQVAREELECRVRERTRQLTSLTSELYLAEERERRRIATQLHDQVGQTLIMNKIRLDTLSLEAPRDELKKVISDISRDVAAAIEDIRSLTFQLSPPLLYEIGFEAAIEWLGEEFAAKHGFRVVFFADKETKPVDEETGIALYQMVRELLVNVARHAEARTVTISVERVDQCIRIKVADDGTGFDCNTGTRHQDKKRCFGLSNIRQRIEYMGGRLETFSEKKVGTRVTLTLPFQERKRTRKTRSREQGKQK